ncbi:MAG: S8 family serine peptidase [Anaerolineales bacterium]|nr:S8 family serine peptidase [Anaerolineales bacterium]
MEAIRRNCPLCTRPELIESLAEAWWLDPEVVRYLSQQNPDWRLDDGACPACLQEALLHVLLSQGDAMLHQQIQHLWPLDARAAFGAIPTPLRMHADPRFTGRGVTLAIVDEGFYPHADLVQPSNRIRVWVDATADPVKASYFDRQTLPTWPEWDTVHNRQWHGTMTSAVAAGRGRMSHGPYRGIASEADLVLIQVENNTQNITDQAIVRALMWIADNSRKLNIRVVNLSIGAVETDPVKEHPVNQAVHRLVTQGVVVVAAAGNDGVRELIPPASAIEAITVGGLDDHSLFSHHARTLWHSNYGVTQDGAVKPELVAPSIWVAAPVLPGSQVERESVSLFKQRHRGDNAEHVEERIRQLKMITPHYQHVNGTSFAAPIVTGVVA